MNRPHTAAADRRARRNIEIGRALYATDDPRHPDMDFGEAVDRQLLTAVGVPVEQHAEIIARQREIRQLREAEQEAIAQNASAVATYAGRMLGLPEGLTFEYR